MDVLGRELSERCRGEEWDSSPDGRITGVVGGVTKKIQGLHYEVHRNRALLSMKLLCNKFVKLGSHFV